jgi:hypothetical protein
MLATNLKDVSIADLETLIENKVREGRSIDYKAQLPGASDRAKKEFLADVSSFANASGGHLVFGMSAAGGIPTALIPTCLDEPEKETMRLENLVRDGIDPRIAGVSTKYVHHGVGYIYIMSIPQSWSGPHIVAFQNWSKFFSRHSAGKYQLDVRQIGEAFIAREALPDRIRDFRKNRVELVIDRSLGFALVPGPTIILHLVPFVPNDAARAIDMNLAARINVSPPGANGWNSRRNFDGVLSYDPDGRGGIRRYAQVFRNGAIEAVDASLLSSISDRRLIPSHSFEEELIIACRSYLQMLGQLDVGFPIAVMLTLTGVAGWGMGVSGRFALYEPCPIEQDILLVPEIMVEDQGAIAEHILHPAFDMVWNAAGYDQSIDYDESGEWHPRQ